MNVFRKLYWWLYPLITNKVVYLQRQICGFCISDGIVSEKYGLTVKLIDYNSESDLREWCDVMNNSYDDCFFDETKAKQFLIHHPLFQANKTVLFYSNAIPCASVSWGYRQKPKVGGDFRIGVKSEFQGCGLGRMCVEYAYARLADEGYKLGESVITVKRVPSLMLHFSLGFEPRYNMRYVSYKGNLKNINLIQRVRLTFSLYAYYQKYKKCLKRKFL